MKHLKIALVQDWLTELGGAEKVFTAIYEMFPHADIYTLAYNENALNKMSIPVEKVTASFIQRLPFAKTKYRNYLPFFSKAIESFDLSKYDLIITSSYAVAKGVLTHAGQLHISYCHSPVRYAWDLYHQYLKEANLNKGIKAAIVKHYLHKLRIWDISSVNRVDKFISNSDFIGRRIKKVYNRDVTTIYPPVNVDDFKMVPQKAGYYVTCSRLVPYKKIDLIVEAFSKMPDKELIVIGTGPDLKKIQGLATSNVKILGYQKFEVLKDYMEKAKAFVFAAEEDFGIVPVEAQACGTPVIAFGKGGSLETVIGDQTGVFFYEQTWQSLVQAVERFEEIKRRFNPEAIANHAQKFSKQRFVREFSSLVENEYKQFLSKK